MWLRLSLALRETVRGRLFRRHRRIIRGAWLSFNLTDRSGRSVSQADLAGKFLVVNFVFTSCSLSCRAVNDRMEEIQRLVAGAPDVRLVSLTVDPRSDTPAVLAKFADGHHADTNRWLFLTGDKAELYRVIETSFIPKSPELEGLIPGGFASTDRIMLVDPEGNVWASFDGLRRNAASAVVAEIEGRRKSTTTYEPIYHHARLVALAQRRSAA